MMASILRPKALLPNTHYMGDVLFVVCTRACPALPQHVQGAHHVGIRFEAATFVDALENRLRRAVAFVPALTVRAGDARPSRIDGNHHTTHFQKLPFDCLAKTVEPRAQDGAVEPLFCFTFLPGFATVPLADAVMFFTFRSSTYTQPYSCASACAVFLLKSCRMQRIFRYNF